MDEYDFDLKMTQLEIEYRRMLSASSAARERLRGLGAATGSEPRGLARARIRLEFLERQCRQLLRAHDEIKRRGGG